MAGPGSTPIPARGGDTTSGAAVHILLDDGDGKAPLGPFSFRLGEPHDYPVGGGFLVFPALLA